MSIFIMRIRQKKFEAKSVDLIAKNFRLWRDSTFSMFGVNALGTHWPIRYAGREYGELTYDGRFWPAGTVGSRPYDVVEEILAQRFMIGDTHNTGYRENPEYRAGVRVALEWRFMRAPMGVPYPPGTDQAAAFLAGLAEGHNLPVDLETAVATAPGQNGRTLPTPETMSMDRRGDTRALTATNIMDSAAPPRTTRRGA
jgi:hypothetical protein